MQEQDTRLGVSGYGSPLSFLDDAYLSVNSSTLLHANNNPNSTTTHININTNNTNNTIALNNSNNSSNNQVCKFWMKGGCRFGNACWKPHTGKQSPASPLSSSLSLEQQQLPQHQHQHHLQHQHQQQHFKHHSSPSSNNNNNTPINNTNNNNTNNNNNNNNNTTNTKQRYPSSSDDTLDPFPDRDLKGQPDHKNYARKDARDLKQIRDQLAGDAYTRYMQSLSLDATKFDSLSVDVMRMSNHDMREDLFGNVNMREVREGGDLGLGYFSDGNVRTSTLTNSSDSGYTPPAHVHHHHHTHPNSGKQGMGSHQETSFFSLQGNTTNTNRNNS